MTLFACNNNDDLNVQGVDNAPKTVVLKLDGIAANVSRSADPNTSDDNKKVTLNDIQVIFYGGGENGFVTKVAHVDATENAADWAKIVNPSEGNGLRYENVPAATTHVMIIGNYDALPETNKNKVTEGASITDIKGMEIPLSSQNTADEGETTKDNITLYGTGELQPFESTAPEDANKDVRQAIVSIKPIISRIEITGISCDFTTPAGEGAVSYSKVDVKGIGLFDYYNTMTLDGKNVSDMMDASLIVKPDAAETPQGGYKFLDATATAWTWAFDQINAETGFTSTELRGTGKVELKRGENNATFAYNFFPATTNIDDKAATAAQKVLANVRLLVDATPASGTEQANNYVVTTSFRDAETGGNIVAPVPGKIYKFEYAFKQENIREEWDANKMVVYVKVTTEEWQIQTVYPNF